uniref:Kelch domain containing 4 n=1 Tax=Cyprinus carpio TaxID=7962 RepID=A0A8C2BHD3_CYPCA
MFPFFQTFLYNELFFYNIKKNTWEKVEIPNPFPRRCAQQSWPAGRLLSTTAIYSPGAPSGRSGHRMVLSKRQLLVFGGFNESTRYRQLQGSPTSTCLGLYLDTFTWSRLKPTGTGPCLRSPLSMATAFFPMSEKKDLLIIFHSCPLEKWTWTRVTPSGVKPPPRCGFSLAVAPGGRALLFDGVCDEEDEETFFNDLYFYDINKNRCFPVQLKGNKSEKKKTNETEGEKGEAKVPTEIIKEIVAEDGTVMTIKEVIPAAQAEEDSEEEEEAAAMALLVDPCPRSSTMATVMHGKLYLCGGMFEVGDRQVTLCDLYSLDLHKMDKWDFLVEMENGRRVKKVFYFNVILQFRCICDREKYLDSKFNIYFHMVQNDGYLRDSKPSLRVDTYIFL